MPEQHRATPDEWQVIKAKRVESIWDSHRDYAGHSCILELLHRVEALEAERQPSLKAQALESLSRVTNEGEGMLMRNLDNIRRALEQLPDHE